MILFRSGLLIQLLTNFLNTDSTDETDETDEHGFIHSNPTHPSKRPPGSLAGAEREAAALRWLARAAADLETAAHSEMAGAVVRVLAQPEWAELFSPAALAEVPVTALVGDRVVAGTIDRLLVTPDVVRIVDFKTGRRPPSSLDEVPLAYLRQMAAYAAALEVAYPGRRIEAALLFTQTPVLIEIPAEVIGVHKRDLSTGE